MITLAPDQHPALGTPPARRGLAIVQLRDELWRVTRTSGEVLGYIELAGDHGATRYRAKRMIVQQQRFSIIGEFWAMGDAVDSLRF